MKMSFQPKDDCYAPQQQQSSAYGEASASTDKDPHYEILEAGLAHNVNSSGTQEGAGWGSNADIEKALRLGECLYSIALKNRNNLVDA